MEDNIENKLMNNIPPFTIGEKIVYITGNNMPKNSIHKVLNIIQFPCGCWVLDVGKRKYSPPGYFTCGGCKKSFFDDKEDNVHWFRSTSFRPVQEAKFPLIKYSKVLEEVEVGSN